MPAAMLSNILPKSKGDSMLAVIETAGRAAMACVGRIVTPGVKAAAPSERSICADDAVRVRVCVRGVGRERRTIIWLMALVCVGKGSSG